MELVLITATINAKQKRDVMTANIRWPPIFQMLLFKLMLMRRFKSMASTLLWRYEDLLWICYLKLHPQSLRQRTLDLRRQDQGLVCQHAQSYLWHAAIILVILQEVSQRHWVYWIWSESLWSLCCQPHCQWQAASILAMHWHVNNLKSSHVESKVNDHFLQWLEKTYVSNCSEGIFHVFATIWLYCRVSPPCDLCFKPEKWDTRTDPVMSNETWGTQIEPSLLHVFAICPITIIPKDSSYAYASISHFYNQIVGVNHIVTSPWIHWRFCLPVFC